MKKFVRTIVGVAGVWLTACVAARPTYLDSMHHSQHFHAIVTDPIVDHVRELPQSCGAHIPPRDAERFWLGCDQGQYLVKPRTEGRCEARPLSFEVIQRSLRVLDGFRP